MIISKATDLRFAHEMAKRLRLEPRLTKAYQLGIVDRTGKRIREPTTPRDKEAYGPMERMVFEMQRLLLKMPGGRSKIATHAAALKMFREHVKTDGQFGYYDDVTLERGIREEMGRLREEAPTNNAGGGAVHGIGVGPQGEPGVDTRARKRRMLRNLLRRRMPS